jgi:hypothetical protein
MNRILLTNSDPQQEKEKRYTSEKTQGTKNGVLLPFIIRIYSHIAIERRKQHDGKCEPGIKNDKLMSLIS